MLEAVVDGVDGDLLELEGVLRPVVDVVEVDGAEELRRPQPLQVEVAVGLARQVGDHGRAGAWHVRLHRQRHRRRALVALRERLRPHLEVGVGVCGERAGLVLVCVLTYLFISRCGDDGMDEMKYEI